MHYRRGLIPSPPDNRDYSLTELFGATNETPPDSYEELCKFVAIRDQGNTNTCVWQSIVQGIRIIQRVKGIEADWASPLFGYWNTLKAMGVMSDDGCIPRLALDVLTKAGFCSETNYPFQETAVLQQPPPNVYAEAFDQRLITSYYRLYSTGPALIRDIQLALSKNKPVIYGGPITKAYEGYKGGILPSQNQPWEGSHMRCLVGYTKTFFWEANSWNVTWGEGGLARHSPESIAYPYNHDFWVFDSAPRQTS